MFGAVVITFAITTLGLLVLMLLNNAKRRVIEGDRLRKNNERLSSQITDMIHQENLRRERAAYDRGLYDGRTTDALYRKMLNKYSYGEQITVMMCGENETAETARRK